MYNVGEAQMTMTDTCMCACILHKKGPSYIKGEMGVMKYKETYMYIECAIHSHRHLTTVLPILHFTTECIMAYFNLESALIILLDFQVSLLHMHTLLYERKGLHTCTCTLRLYTHTMYFLCVMRTCKHNTNAVKGNTTRCIVGEQSRDAQYQNRTCKRILVFGGRQNIYRMYMYDYLDLLQLHTMI